MSATGCKLKQKIEIQIKRRVMFVPSGPNPIGSVSVRRAVDDNAGAAVLHGRVVHLDGTAATVVLRGTSV